MLDQEFKKQRARTVRDLAAKAADPFIKRRLLDLVSRYEDEGPKTSVRLAPVDLQLKATAPGQSHKVVG